MRATEKQLASKCAAIHKTATTLGLFNEGEATHLELGSKTYGRAFRLALMKPGKSGHYPHPLGDYLGMTKSEALDALGHILTALYAVEDAERSKSMRAA